MIYADTADHSIAEFMLIKGLIILYQKIFIMNKIFVALAHFLALTTKVFCNVTRFVTFRQHNFSCHHQQCIQAIHKSTFAHLADVMVKDIAIGVEGLGFHSSVGHIGRSVASDSPPLRRFIGAVLARR